MFGQYAQRDIVYASFGDFHQCPFVDSSRGFEFATSAAPRHGPAYVGEAEIVQHRNIRSRRDGLLEFIEVTDFDFHRFFRMRLPCAADGPGDSAAGADMVFLDEKRVVQPLAVIVAAADAHRVFLRAAQARNSLAGIEQPAFGMGDRGRQLPVAGGYAAEQLQKCGGSLRREHRAAVASDRGNRASGGDAVSFLEIPVGRQGRIELPVGFIDPGAPAKHRGLARNRSPRALRRLFEQGRGDIAAADVLGQRPAHLFAVI